MKGMEGASKFGHTLPKEEIGWICTWQGTVDAMHQPLKSADFSLVGEVPKPLVAWATTPQIIEKD